MRGASAALLISLVAAATALLHPEDEAAVAQLKRQLLAGLGMQRPPDMSRVNTTAEQLQRMTRRYYRNLRDSEKELLTFHHSGFERNSYLIFNISASDLSNIQWAKLRVPNSPPTDVSSVVQNWKDSGARGALRVRCKGRQCKRAKLLVMVRSSRRKRSTCNGQCCRRSLKINFKEIGWNWIVKPEEFEAYYCKGRCRNVTSDFASTHALMQSILNIKGYKVSRPCCSPRKLRALDLLHYNDKTPAELVVTRQKGMIVKDCACS